jgi:D-tyrosyl-tRNA(Tyr) deacylase
MRALVQRVTGARVVVAGQIVGEVGRGLVVLLGVHREDGPDEADWLARKTAALRVFPDDAGRFDRSLLDVGGGALVVSQFTLLGDARRGNRPSFTDAADPEVAQPLYERYCEALREAGAEQVERGVFGAAMRVELVNDGPVTVLLESPSGG